MRSLAALWLLSRLALAGAAETATPTASPTPFAGPAAAEAPAGTDPAEWVRSARRGVDAELGPLGEGALADALASAARSGLRLRLLLDPSKVATRRQALALAALTPSAEVRWSRGAGQPRRWLNVDGRNQLAWTAPGRPKALSGAARVERFENDWSAAARDLPEALRLNDQLQSLPDPREKDPHYVRRRAGGAP